jgi:hypothetical protein
MRISNRAKKESSLLAMPVAANHSLSGLLPRVEQQQLL